MISTADLTAALRRINATPDTSGIYVHIPYCRSKCAYCAFYSLPRIPGTNFVDAVIKEYNVRKSEISLPVSTIYFGGGTPSLLTPSVFSRLADALTHDNNPSEFTVECNPDDITPELVQTWRLSGVNRVSMGVQSLTDAALRQVGRRHDAASACRAYDVLRKCGIDNISLDLIIGLPGESLQSWHDTLDRILAMRPEHLSAYVLSFEENTPLTARLDAGLVSEAPDDLIFAMSDSLNQRAAAAGYDHYEISNFALPGCRSQHNSGYWNFSPYLGLGPAAHSYDGLQRRYNADILDAYLINPLSISVADPESALDRLNDYIMVRLRTADGLDLSLLPQSIRDAILENLKDTPSDLYACTEGRLRIPPVHFLQADTVMRAALL